jgi:hypothetical protein
VHNIVSSAIAHVIGTVSLLMIFFSIGGFYQSYYSILSQRAQEAQLKQIASYVASNLIDIVTLGQTVGGDQFLIKSIDIPYSINNYLYNISISLMPSSTGEENIIRIVTSISKLNDYAIVNLPWTASGNIKIYTNQTIPRADVMVTSHQTSNKASSEIAINKKPVSTIVWCMKNSNEITIGLGVLTYN